MGNVTHGAMGYRGYGPWGLWAMGAQGVWGTGVWGTWAIGAQGVWSTRGMGNGYRGILAMGNGAQGYGVQG